MATRKAKRYDDGGDVDAYQSALNQQMGEDYSNQAPSTTDEGPQAAPAAAAPTPAPKATPKAAPKPAPKAQAKPSGNAGRGGQGGASYAEMMAAQSKSKPASASSDREGGIGPYKMFSRAKTTDEGLAKMRAKDQATRNEQGIGGNLKELASRMRRAAGITSYAKGGSISSRGDGIAQRGKTKGRTI